MKSLFCVFFLMAVPVMLLAECEFELRTEQLIYTLADTNQSIPGQLIISRKKDSGPHCNDYFLAFSKGAAGSYNRRALGNTNEFLLYNVYKNPNMTGVLKEAADVLSNNDILSGSIKKDTTEVAIFYLQPGVINSSELPLAGRYRDTLKVHAYSGTYSNAKYEMSRDQYIEFIVPKFISLSLVGKDEPHDQYKTARTIDFGELEEREFGEFDVRIVSNAGFVLKVSSLNNGVLKRVNGSGANSEIAYDFFANGIAHSLRGTAVSPAAIAISEGKTLSVGAHVPVKIIIKNVSNKEPGTYQDYLTLSVISNE